MERVRLLRHLLGVRRIAAGLALARRRPAPRRGRPRVVFLSPAPPSDVGMAHRTWCWKGPLEARGFEVAMPLPCPPDLYDGLWTRGPAGDRAYQEASLRALPVRIRLALDADAVVLHRGLLPFSPWQRPDLELALVRKNPRVVFDFFDSIWLGRREAHARAPSVLGRWLNPPDRVERLCGAAAAVTVSSGYLADFAREHSPSVHEIPMVLDADGYPAKEHGERSPVVLGWMGNAGNLQRLASVVPALRRVAEGTRVRLRVVSWERFEAEGLEVESLVHPWSPENEREDLASFDVGLLPMFDTPYDRGKSPFKLLQYAAAGLPVVASPVAIDPGVFEDGVSILFASTEGEWAAAVSRLARDPGLRARMGRAARAVVRDRFGVEAHADRFAALLREVSARE